MSNTNPIYRILKARADAALAKAQDAAETAWQDPTNGDAAQLARDLTYEADKVCAILDRTAC
jgi:hypothetical protein